MTEDVSSAAVEYFSESTSISLPSVVVEAIVDTSVDESSVTLKSVTLSSVPFILEMSRSVDVSRSRDVLFLSGLIGSLLDIYEE